MTSDIKDYKRLIFDIVKLSELELNNDNIKVLINDLK